MEWSARVVFCDDIRQEFNGKFILIGVYAGELITSEMPVNTPIATYIDVRNLAAGKHSCVINAVYEMDDDVLELASLASTIHVNDPDLPCVLVGGGMNLTAEKPGILRIMIGIDEATPKVADTLRVTLTSRGASTPS